MAGKSHAISIVNDSGLVLMLIFFTAVLFILNFFVSANARFLSSEVMFTDYSAAGMQLTPASCASSPAYYHSLLVATADGKGYVSTAGSGERGINAPYLGRYVCVTNTTSPGRNYFVPALTLVEYNQFKAKVPAGVAAY